mmetsp:Transcript_31925/g.61442  ORF Transcript_31925/g.61442 Transcript_31925/m.61442 type:complete len:120 (-) Transcript_31925:330-689(-)
MPACHAIRRGAGHGHTLVATGHGHAFRGAATISAGSIGPAAMGYDSFDSCLSQHSPREWLWIVYEKHRSGAGESPEPGQKTQALHLRDEGGSLQRAFRPDWDALQKNLPRPSGFEQIRR